MELNELIDTADGLVFSTKNRKKTGDTFLIYLFIEYFIYVSYSNVTLGKILVDYRGFCMGF